MYPVISESPSIQREYVQMRRKGESHNIAKIIALRSCPALHTDDELRDYFGNLPGTGGDEVNAWRRSEAESAGVNTAGSWYCSGLASFPGDPSAWVKGRGDIRRVAESKNMSVTGAVEVKSRNDIEPPAPIPIGEDILEQRVAKVLSENPEANKDDVREREFRLATGKEEPYFDQTKYVSDHDFGLEI